MLIINYLDTIIYFHSKLVVNEKYSNLPWTVNSRDEVLLDVVGSRHASDEDGLAGFLFPQPLFEAVKGFLQTTDDLFGMCQNEQDIGLAEELSAHVVLIGDQDAARLRH